MEREGVTEEEIRKEIGTVDLGNSSEIVIVSGDRTLRVEDTQGKRLEKRTSELSRDLNVMVKL